MLPNEQIWKYLKTHTHPESRAIDSNRIRSRNRVMSDYWPVGGKKKANPMWTLVSSWFCIFFICLPLWKQISRDKWLGHSWPWRCCEPWRWEDYSCMSHLIQSLIQEMPGKHHLFNLLQTVTFLVCRGLAIELFGFSGLPRNEVGSGGMECLQVGSIFHLRKMSLMG